MQKLLLAVTASLLAVSAAIAAEAEPPFVNIGLCSGSSLHGGSVSPLDPRTMLVQSDMSNAFYSHDGGQTWHLIHMKYLRGGGTTTPAEYDPADANVIYWTDGRTVKMTRDRGVTWAAVGRSQPWDENNHVRRIYLDPDLSGRLFVGGDSGMHVTENGGKEWKQIETVTGRVFKIAADRTSPKDKRVYFVGTSGGVFRSDDGGADVCEEGLGPAARRADGLCGRVEPGGNDPVRLHALHGLGREARWRDVPLDR